MPTHGSTRHDEPQADLIARAAAVAASRRGSGGPPREAVETFLQQYYRHVAVEDLVERADVDLYGAAVSQYAAAAERPQGTANVRVFTPTVDEHGWSAGAHTVVEVVTDDMSFLVDSVTMALNEEGRNVHLVIHPQLLVRRDVAGRLAEVIDDEGYQVGQDGADPDVGRESWMHVEIDREVEDVELAEIEQRLRKVLLDVREAVEDWERMQHQRRRGRSRSCARPRRRWPTRRSSRARRCSSGSRTTTSRSWATGSTGWATSTGSRTARSWPCPAPATASCARTPT